MGIVSCTSRNKYCGFIFLRALQDHLSQIDLKIDTLVIIGACIHSWTSKVPKRMVHIQLFWNKVGSVGYFGGPGKYINEQKYIYIHIYIYVYIYTHIHTRSLSFRTLS